MTTGYVIAFTVTSVLFARVTSTVVRSVGVNRKRSRRDGLLCRVDIGG